MGETLLLLVDTLLNLVGLLSLLTGVYRGAWFDDMIDYVLYTGVGIAGLLGANGLLTNNGASALAIGCVVFAGGVGYAQMKTRSWGIRREGRAILKAFNSNRINFQTARERMRLLRYR